MSTGDEGARRDRASARRAGLRRLGLLLGVALLSAALGAVLGANAGEEPATRPEAGAGAGSAPGSRGDGSRRTPPARIPRPGAALLLAFDGTTPPPYVRRILRRGDAAGVFLRGSNVVSLPQLRALTAVLRAAGGAGTLVAVDQEGGLVQDVPGAGPAVGAPASSSPAATGAGFRRAGRVLREAGVTLDLAPVADAARPGGALAARSYPAPAGPHVAAAVSALRAEGVLAAAKHFPGLGAATANTDDAPVDVTVPRAELGAVDLPPFAAAIRAGVPVVMASHARYPALDPEAIASRSRPILTALLRDELGFRGAVVTDSLEAAAALAGTTLEAGAVASIRAGVDLLLTTGRGSWIRVRRALGREAARSAAFRARLAEALERVRSLRERAASRR